MEEDIKQLEELILDRKSFVTGDKEHDEIFLKDIQALENLIKRYRELERTVKIKNGDIEYIQNKINKHFISDTKIQKKIEELDKQRIKMEKDDIGVGFALGEKWSNLKAKIQVLQELMEDK